MTTVNLLGMFVEDISDSDGRMLRKYAEDSQFSTMSSRAPCSTLYNTSAGYTGRPMLNQSGDFWIVPAKKGSLMLPEFKLCALQAAGMSSGLPKSARVYILTA